uniref:Uncharacterized protein n=1 Tax=Rhizophora mucronata TaxID=61149 RepID=A0A2P2Q5G4_RHIMU
MQPREGRRSSEECSTNPKVESIDLLT